MLTEFPALNDTSPPLPSPEVLVVTVLLSPEVAERPEISIVSVAAMLTVPALPLPTVNPRSRRSAPAGVAVPERGGLDMGTVVESQCWRRDRYLSPRSRVEVGDRHQGITDVVRDRAQCGEHVHEVTRGRSDTERRAQ
jgi:hypothetical protein